MLDYTLSRGVNPLSHGSQLPIHKHSIHNNNKEYHNLIHNNLPDNNSEANSPIHKSLDHFV